MNRSYKLVFNKKRGEFVVASELAQGAKKSSAKRILPLAGVALLSVLGATLAPAQAFSLNTEYTPGKYVDENGKLYSETEFQDLVNKGEAPKIGDFKDTHNNNMITNHGVLFVKGGGKQIYGFDQDIRFDAKQDPEDGLYKTIGLKELMDGGYLSLQDGNGKIITEYEEVYGWNIAKAAEGFSKKLFSEAEIEDLKSQGKWDEALEQLNINIIEDISTAKEPLKITQTVTDLNKQPHKAFNNFTLVKVEGKATIFNPNIFVLSPEKDVNWDLHYSKNTSLFIAEGKTGLVGIGGKIEVGSGKLSTGSRQKVISVDFGSDHSVGIKPLQSEEFQVKNKLGENVNAFKLFGEETFKNIPVFNLNSAEPEKTYGDLYPDGIIAINNDAGFQQYLKFLEDYAKHLILGGDGIKAEDINKYLQAALVPSEEKYVLEILKEFEINKEGFLLTDDMRAPGGIRSIVKATGKGSKIVLNEDVRLHATASGGHAYNVFAEKEAEVSHEGKTGVYGNGARNALINNSTYTNEKDGEQYVGYQSEDGGQTSSVGLYSVVVGDVVQGSKGSHINKGSIFVAAKGQNTALFVTDGAKAENRPGGKFYIGSINGGGRASGVEIQGKGNFINNKRQFFWEDDGIMTLGIAKDGSDVVVNNSDNPRVTNDSSKYSTIVSVRDIVSPESDVKVQNEGVMIVGASVTNAVALDIKGKADDSARYEGEKGRSDNKLKFENSGIITLNGTNNIGIKSIGIVSDYLQSNVVNKGTIEVFGSNSYGIYAADGSIVSNKGIIHVKSSNTDRNYAVVANNATINLEKPTKITLEGDNVVGLMAVSGGVVYAEAVDKPTFGSGINQIHYWISGGYLNDAKHRSRIVFGKNADLSIANEDSVLFRVDKKGELIAKNTDKPTLDNANYTFTVNGKGSTGIFVADKGTKVEIDETTLNVRADGATGIKVTSGAGLDGKVTLSANTKIDVSGDRATVAIVDGIEHDSNGETNKNIGAKLISEAHLTSKNISIKSGAIGYDLLRRGELEHKGSIDFTDSDIPAPVGKELVGVRVEGGKLTNLGSIKVNGVGVDVYKDNKEVSTVNNSKKIIATDGIAGIRVNKDASLTISGSEGGKVVGQEAADAILAKGGSTLAMNKGKVVVEGKGAGIHFQNADDEAGGFRLSGSGNVDVIGSGHGIHVEGLNGKTSENGFNSEGSNDLTITVVENNGNGILINTRGDIHSGASVNMLSDEAKSALVVTGGSKKITQSGTLESASLNNDSSLVDLTRQNRVYNDIGPEGSVVYDKGESAYKDYKFINLGKVLAKPSNSNENQIAVKAESYGKNVSISIVNGSGQNSLESFIEDEDKNKIKITGDIQLNGSANYNVQLYGNSASEDTITDSGNDTFTLTNVKGEKDSQLLFKALDGGAGKNTLVLNTEKAGPKDNVEINPDSHYVFTDAVLKNIADLEIKAGSRFELANAELVDSAMAKDNYLNIDIVDKGQLDINQSNGKGDYIFNNKLLGSGLVTTNLGNTEHKFQFTDSNTGGDFKGIFAINNGAFEIVNKNAAALKEATLRLDNKTNKTDMGIGVIKKVGSRDERETIKGLIFNGGQLVVEEEITTGKIASQIDSMLTVGTLDLSEGGSISLSLGKEVNDVFTASTPDDILYSKDLLLQDEGKFTIQLVESTQDVISGGAVVVVDLDGNKIELGEESKKEIGIYQEDIANPVATGNYGLVTQTNAAGASKEDGLYLSYALDTVTLLGKTDASIGADWYKGALNLQVAEGGSDNAQTFKASILGDGDLVINTNPAKGALKLSGANDYKGATYVISGDLELLGDKALGKTRLLDIASGSAVTLSKDVNSSVGQLQTAQNSGLHLGAVGSLTITGKKYDENDTESDIGLDNIIAGSLTGGTGAKLVLEMNKLQVVGANTRYGGDVDVQKSTTLELNHTQGVGNDGQVDLAGTLHLNGVGKGTYQKQISGVDGSTVLVDNDSTVAFVADHIGISEINIGGASGSDESRVIVLKETHLAGSDKNATAKVDIRKNSTLEFNINEEHWVVKNEVSGAGNLYKSGAGIIELNEESAKYTGKTTVASGILIAGNTDKALDLQSTEMFIDQSGTFAGFGSINGAVTNKGNFFVGKLVDTPADPHGTIESKYAEKSQVELDETGVDSTEVVENAPTINNKDNVYTIKGNLENSGNIFLSNSFVEDRLETGTNLKVEGNYFANGGAIFMNTTLNAGHEAESTDKLIVSGNVVKKGDATKLYISNAQGNGAYTDEQPDAIEVVHVEGTSDNNAFVLGNRVAIGVYEYNLHKGIGIENAESWFLDSYDKNLNPGIGAFIGNQNAAIGMFSMTLHDRMGNLGYSDPSLITEDDDTLNSAWVRIVAERNKYKAIDKQMSIKSNTYIVHLGADFYKWTDDLGATRRLGVMAGYGHGDIKSRSNTGFNAEGTIEAAYNLGLYGTYYNPNGFYVDAWAQHSWFKNKIALEGDSQTYRSKLLSLSVELGHTFDISEVSDNDKQWRLQPQAQLTWHKYKLNNNVVSGSGLAVTNLPSHTTVARLGVKLIHANVRQEDRKMQPFVEVNWLHSNANKAIEFNNWYETSNNAPKNRYELKVGVEGRYNNRWSMWGNVATQMGKDSYRNYRGTIGAKYDF